MVRASVWHGCGSERWGGDVAENRQTSEEGGGDVAGMSAVTGARCLAGVAGASGRVKGRLLLVRRGTDDWGLRLAPEQVGQATIYFRQAKPPCPRHQRNLFAVHEQSLTLQATDSVDVYQLCRIFGVRNNNTSPFSPVSFPTSCRSCRQSQPRQRAAGQYAILLHAPLASETRRCPKSGRSSVGLSPNGGPSFHFIKDNDTPNLDISNLQTMSDCRHTSRCNRSYISVSSSRCAVEAR
jgi:hypothetical protein